MNSQLKEVMYGEWSYNTEVRKEGLEKFYPSMSIRVFFQNKMRKYVSPLACGQGELD